MTAGLELPDQLGLRPVVNAAGKMTYLGSSACSESVAAAMGAAASRWVEMDSLYAAAGGVIAECTGGQAGFVTSCAAAGIAIGTAACVAVSAAGGDAAERHANRRALLQRGHAVDFGAPITAMLALGGAEVEIVGHEDGCSLDELEAALTGGAAVAVFVISHHVATGDFVGLDAFIRSSHAAGVPVLVDAAAETDLRRYTQAGADLVVYSGHKAISGPTSGLMTGRAELIEACEGQRHGLARAMKIGKESIFGLLVALREYEAQDLEKQRAALLQRVGALQYSLGTLDAIDAEVVEDETRPIPRLRIRIRGSSPISTEDIVSALRNRSPSVWCRAHHAAEGFIELDPRTLDEHDIPILVEQITAVLNDSRSSSPEFKLRKEAMQ
ncbi:MAG: aminotransferase class V-fold PLP-dependent enzyme [Acidimicrobiales bacterium]